MTFTTTIALNSHMETHKYNLVPSGPTENHNIESSISHSTTVCEAQPNPTCAALCTTDPTIISPQRSISCPISDHDDAPREVKRPRTASGGDVIQRSRSRQNIATPLINTTTSTSIVSPGPLYTVSTVHRGNDRARAVLQYEAPSFNGPLDMLYLLYIRASYARIASMQGHNVITTKNSILESSTTACILLSKHDFLTSESQVWRVLDLSFLDDVTRATITSAAEQYCANYMKK